MNRNLLIATPSRGAVRVEWATALRIQAQPTGLDWAIITVQNMTCDDARNTAVQLAKDENFEYLLFYDDDIVPRDDMAIIRLVNALKQHGEIDVIGGVYPRRYSVNEPIVVKEEGHGVWWGWDDGNVHPVYMTGTGLMLLRMSRLPEVETYVSPEGTEMGRYFHHVERETDDLYFAAICAHTGRKWYVHGGVTAAQMDLDGRIYDFEDARQKLVPA